LGYYYKIARAEDNRVVDLNRIRKSIGAETSPARNLGDRHLMLQELQEITLVVQQRLEQNQTQGRTLTLKVKFSDYQQITRSQTMLNYTHDLKTIIATATLLFKTMELENHSIRLLGISLSNLENVKQILGDSTTTVLRLKQNRLEMSNIWKENE